MKHVFTRRQIVKSLIALGVGGTLLWYWESLPGDDHDTITVIGGDGKPTLEIFAFLSTIVTLRDDLNPVMMKRMYDIFLDEPWGADHMLRCYRKIAKALPRKGSAAKRLPLQNSSWQFDKGEKWFLSHLLRTWYTGIYSNEERPSQTVSYEHALMFAVTKGCVPIPFLDATGFGKWASPPDSGE